MLLQRLVDLIGGLVVLTPLHELTYLATDLLNAIVIPITAPLV